jgi:hypothetical protein
VREAEQKLLMRLRALHERVQQEPGRAFTDELTAINDEAEREGISLFRLITDHYPAFLPYYYFMESAS